MRRMTTTAIVLALAGGLGVSAAQAKGCDLKASDAAKAGRGCQRAWMDANLKLNDLMSVGTHNSYKTEIPPAVMALYRSDGKSHDALDYRHRPLLEQLDAGARQIEIDVYYDPQGGRFSDPILPKRAGVVLEPERLAALAKPGFKVMHVPDIDVLSACPTLVGCLQIIRGWSLKHPDHTPILLMFNAKTDRSSQGGVGALPFDETAFDALDREIRSAIPAQQLITPDDVQGRYPTLREAVMHDNWPTLGHSRGKVLFALDEGPEKVATYRGKRASLEGRVFFVNTDEASPAAAYLTLNDPIAEPDRIRRDVQAGFIVRTRADADTVEARANDTRRREAALASGAQWVSSDYMWPEPRLANGYQVRLPNGEATVCNPVRAAAKCAGLAVETVAGAKGR